jgi:hypothetical protein
MMVVEGALVMIQPAAHLEDAHIVRIGRSTVENRSLTYTMTGLGSTPEHSKVKDRLKSGSIYHGYAHMATVEGKAVVVFHPADNMADSYIVRLGLSTVKHRYLACTLACLCLAPERSTVNDCLKSGLHHKVNFVRFEPQRLVVR